MTSGIRASRFEAMANKGDNNVGGASGIMVDENRGLKESGQGDKKSREESYQHMEGLESDFVDLREDFKSALNVLGRNVGHDIHDLRDLRVGVSLCKRFMASGGGYTSTIAPKVDVPKPSTFMGKQEAWTVDDFL
nr:hypothetical protein [Tanacetum cinerariifolium]